MARRLESAAREALLLRRNVLLGLRHDHLVGEGELLAEPEPDPGDLAAMQSSAGSLETLSQSELRQLDEVHRALRRIDEGTYGRCEGCGAPIRGRRLEAVPWTPCCVACAGAAEAQTPRPPMTR